MLNFKNFSKPFVYEKICGVKLEDKRSINWLDFDDAKNVIRNLCCRRFNRLVS